MPSQDEIERWVRKGQEVSDTLYKAEGLVGELLSLSPGANYLEFAEGLQTALSVLELTMYRLAGEFRRQNA